MSAIIAAIYALSMTLRIDSVQRLFASAVAEKAGAFLETPIHAGALRISHIDEIILSDVAIFDQKGDTIIVADKVTAHISPFKLLKNRIQVNTLNIAAPRIKIYKDTEESPLNIQFLLDKLKSDEEKEPKFSLRINQLLVYDGKFTYDINDAPAAEAGVLDKSHIAVDRIRCNVSLKKLLKEEFDLLVRAIAGTERSGLELRKLKTRIDAVNGKIRVRDLEAYLPGSRFVSDSLTVSYDKKNIKALEFSGNLESEHITLADFTPLYPGLPELLPAFSFSINGHSDSTMSRAAIQAGLIDYNASLKAVVTASNPYDSLRNVNLYIRQLNLDRKSIELAESFIPSAGMGLAEKIGDCSLSGEAGVDTDKLSGSFTLETINGIVSADADIDKDGSFKVSASGDGVDIGNIADLGMPMNCSLQANIGGNISNESLAARFSSEIIDFQTGQYTFAPVSIDGSINTAEERFLASIKIDDPAVKANMSLGYDKADEERIILSLDADSLIPFRFGMDELGEKKFSFNLDGELSMHDNRISMLNAKLQNITMQDEAGTSTIRNLHFCDSRDGDQRLMMLNSDFIKCSVIGDFEYTAILNSFYNIAATHAPSLNLKKRTTGYKNNYILNCELYDSRFISRLLDLPAVINKPSSIQGTCHDEKGIISLNGKFNDIVINKSKYNTFEINTKSDNERITLNALVSLPAKNRKNDNESSEMKIMMNSSMSRDTIKNSFLWHNNKEKRSTKGRLRLEAMLNRDTCDILSINAMLSPDSIVHKDSVWYISGGKISGNTEKISIEGLHLYNASQYLHLDGHIGKKESDILHVKANNLEVSTILDLVRFRILQFTGKATGEAEISGLMSAPSINGTFNVDSFKIDNGYLGRTGLSIGWDNSRKAITLGADIINDNGKCTNVNGFLSQANDTIHLDIKADELNASFINRLTGSFLRDIDGTASGNVSLLGGWRKIDLKGAIALNCGARLLHTNVKYNFHGDSLYFTSGRLSFNEALVTDRRGNKGWLSGEVTHQHLGKWSCNLNARADNLLVYDTNNFDTLPLYGTVYATGNVNLNTNEKGIYLKAEVSNNPNSRIVYNSSDLGGVRDNSFVTFKDSSKEIESGTGTTERRSTANVADSKLNLDFLLDINEAMQVKVYTNLKSDDYIDLYGKGTINAIYDEKEGFSMKGNLDLDRGTYKITVQDIFTKEFTISKGSTLLFNGDPYHATLDLKTKYLVPSASLNALTTESTKRKSVKVNCLMNITGTLESPVLSFDLELPEGSEEEKEMLASATSTPDQKNMQFIYLLGIGKFYTYDYNNPLATNTQSTTAMESLISNTLSGQLNNMLGQIIDNGNWNISGNISTSERGWNSMEVEGMLEGRLLNDRLLINGNFGYRENPIANRNFIGDFELQWLLNKTGTVSLRAYSKTNDRYFSKTNLTTQGAGIILRHDFNRWLWWKKDKKNKKTKKEKKGKR